MSACIALIVIDGMPNVSLIYTSNHKDARGYPQSVLACCVDVEVLTSAEAVHKNGR